MYTLIMNVFLFDMYIVVCGIVLALVETVQGRTTVGLGIDTLIANSLVLYVLYSALPISVLSVECTLIMRVS